MITVSVWTGREALLLRTAFRLSQRGFAARLGVSERIVATWEKRGSTITPRSEVQAIFDTTLAMAPADVQLRFQQIMNEASDTPSPDRPPAPTAHRAHSFGPTASNESSSQPLTSIDAEQIELLAVELTAWDHARGGSLVRIAAVAQARWAADLVRAPAADSVRRAIAKASAQLCLAAGFMAFDAQQHDEADSVFSLALDCARIAGDPRLEAKALSHQGRQAIWCGDPYGALNLLDGALELPALAGSERAMLHSARARAFAKLNRVQETLAAVNAADQAFAQHELHDTPAWMEYYDFAQHQGDTGHALFDLAVRGREQTETLVRLRAAVEGHDSGHVRSQAFSRAKLATLKFACGEPEEALVAAVPAAKQIGALRSARALATLQEMARYARPYRALPGADELSELVGTEAVDGRA